MSTPVEQTGPKLDASVRRLAAAPHRLMFFAGATIAKMIFQDTMFALGGGLIGASLPIFYLRFRRRRRLKAFGAQLPHALDLLRS